MLSTMRSGVCVCVCVCECFLLFSALCTNFSFSGRVNQPVTLVYGKTFSFSVFIFHSNPFCIFCCQSFQQPCRCLCVSL